MAWLPIRSLFWRAFLTFWGAMAIITVCGMMLTAAVAWYRVDSLDGLNPGNLTRDATQIARTDGADGLRRWLAAMDARYSALKIYIVDTQDREILGRRLPTRLGDWLAAFRASPDAGMLTAIDVAADPDALRVSWWDPQLLILPDRSPLLMLFLPFDSSHWEMLGLTPVALGLLLFALAITAPFCWALTRHVAAPLDHLRRAAARWPPAGWRRAAPTPWRCARTKWLLARDFDAMAGRLQALVDTREQLLRNIAHELRSPLARLRLGVELARRKDERQDLQLDRIERECERLDALVGSTLRLARMGALPSPTETLDLAEVVDDVVQDARFEAGDRDITIGWRRPAPLRVAADRDSLASAIENVLRNALRFTPAGGAIQVRLLADAGEASLEIEDSGPGAPEKELAYLFEPFYQSAANADAPQGGAGLGLSIARAAVAAHKGRISARNVAPNGLSVRIELPRAAA
ncbi:HAMP domain-containing sensor histidine kinase [Achromobacter insuavis]